MQQLIGTWKFISATSEEIPSGAKRDLYGPDATGFINYAPDGRMMVLVVSAGRQRPGATVASPAEAEALFRTMMSYAGRYTIEGDRITHYVDVAWNETWTGTRQTRLFRLDGNRVRLSTPPSPDPFTGTMSVRTMIWEKLQ
jgi:hypothetical protein